jgi:hypothetical protein
MINTFFSLVLLFAMVSPLWAGERPFTPEPFDRFGGTHIKVDDKGNIWAAFYDLKGDIHIRNASGERDLAVNEGRERAPGGIGFDVQGDNIYAVWREKIGGKKLWFRASYDGGKTLGDPILLDDRKNAPLPSIEMSSNAKGDVFILYLGEAKVDDSKYNLYFTASHDFGKTFSEAKNMTPGYQNSIYPVLFAEGERVYMFSDSGKNEKRFMIFRRSADGGRTWSEPVEIRETAGAAVYIEPIRAGKRLCVFWLDAVDGEHIVAAAFSDDDGQTWKSRVLDDTRGLDIGLMSVANDSEGHIYLAFSAKREDKEKPNIFVMSSEDNGDTWGKPFILRHYPFVKTQAVNPHIIATEKGVAVVVWVDYRNIRSNLYMQFSKDNGKTWQEKDIPLEEPGRSSTAHYPLTQSLLRIGDAYYELAYRFENDLTTSTGKADLLLMDFKLENSMVEDQGSPKKIDLLRERANDFWNAIVKEDYEKAYSIYEPFFRATYTGSTGIDKVKGKIKYHKAEVKDIQVEGNIAKVKVSIVYSLPPTRFKTQVFTQPETPSEFEETWLYVHDNWYKEYYMAVVEKGVANY